MQLNLLKSKIHRAEVTDLSLHYEGSLAVDRDFMTMVGLREYEKILVGNMANGERFETYAIAAPAGSKTISLNGATAHLGKRGDLLTIMSFAAFEAAEAETWQPKVLLLGEGNTKIIKRPVAA
ncbi:aspartate 1-decarboxylase [Synoicihabitans lomoniglobus]|uniref:Aspartate 1-decarboxylase n=1 Tax=Synoicihabitans lomoniglobus TaxID=2909285 RepID=A0AAF0CS22_9BACT|nr:aspartate 1-decarboxylase [Opitutaceae bacterium LMO-M01]WED67043.1 aspartate 1-decarboxylase [Opitutaceae bacterium LMO-M01]